MSISGIFGLMRIEQPLELSLNALLSLHEVRRFGCQCLEILVLGLNPQRMELRDDGRRSSLYTSRKILWNQLFIDNHVGRAPADRWRKKSST